VQFDKEAFPLVSTDHHNKNTMTPRHAFYYGWVIVAACAVTLVIHAGVMYSYGIFFKHLIAEFGWSRAATSGVHSLFMVIHGGSTIVMGWLVDKFGPAKVMSVCDFITGLGLVLTSRISVLWQLYATYGLIVGIGVGAGFTPTMATTTRWFIKHCELALGIVASGTGLGTLILALVAERLIATFGWSTAYFILGVTTWLVLIPSALFLRRDPEAKGLQHYGMDKSLPTLDIKQQAGTGKVKSESGIALKADARYKLLWIVFSVFFLFKHIGLWEVKARPPPRANALPKYELSIDYSDSNSLCLITCREPLGLELGPKGL